ncbi:MAG: hypothetical protein AAF401_15015 [Pseudomonadota bacterium]
MPSARFADVIIKETKPVGKPTPSRRRLIIYRSYCKRTPPQKTPQLMGALIGSKMSITLSPELVSVNRAQMKAISELSKSVPAMERGEVLEIAIRKAQPAVKDVVLDSRLIPLSWLQPEPGYDVVVIALALLKRRSFDVIAATGKNAGNAVTRVDIDHVDAIRFERRISRKGDCCPIPPGAPPKNQLLAFTPDEAAETIKKQDGRESANSKKRKKLEELVE